MQQEAARVVADCKECSHSDEDMQAKGQLQLGGGEEGIFPLCCCLSLLKCDVCHHGCVTVSIQALLQGCQALLQVCAALPRCRAAQDESAAGAERCCLLPVPADRLLCCAGCLLLILLLLLVPVANNEEAQCERDACARRLGSAGSCLWWHSLHAHAGLLQQLPGHGRAGGNLATVLRERLQQAQRLGLQLKLPRGSYPATAARAAGAGGLLTGGVPACAAACCSTSRRCGVREKPNLLPYWSACGGASGMVIAL